MATYEEYTAVPTSDLQNVGNAIRSKNGETQTYQTSELAGAVERINTNGAVTSVNGKTGAVQLTANDVKAIPTTERNNFLNVNNLTKATSDMTQPVGWNSSTKKLVTKPSSTETSTETVSSVFGRQGAVVAQKGDYTADMVGAQKKTIIINTNDCPLISEGVYGPPPGINLDSSLLSQGENCHIIIRHDGKNKYNGTNETVFYYYDKIGPSSDVLFFTGGTSIMKDTISGASGVGFVLLVHSAEIELARGNAARIHIKDEAKIIGKKKETVLLRDLVENPDGSFKAKKATLPEVTAALDGYYEICDGMGFYRFSEHRPGEDKSYFTGHTEIDLNNRTISNARVERDDSGSEGVYRVIHESIEVPPPYQYSTTNLQAGVSNLKTGQLYFVYE